MDNFKDYSIQNYIMAIFLIKRASHQKIMYVQLATLSKACFQHVFLSHSLAAILLAYEKHNAYRSRIRAELMNHVEEKFSSIVFN